MMTSEHSTKRKRRALAGAALAITGSVGLIMFPLISRLPFLSETVVFSLVFALAVLMGTGAIVTVFNLKEP